jgi:hypothetical protein
MHDHLDKTKTERTRIEERWLLCQQKILTLEDELTQARAHVDLYKIQVQEANEETEVCKVKHMRVNYHLS